MKGIKTGGRTAGTPNKLTGDLRLKINAIVDKQIDSIEKDEAKRIQTEIKNLKLKVSAVNQGDEIRVTGKNIDDLQAIMKHLRSIDLKAPLVFDNFK